MRAGTLRHAIILQKPGTTRDSRGGEIPTFTDTISTRGDARPVRGKEYFAASAEHAGVDTEWRIRYRPDITPKWRVKWGTRIFEVISAIDPEERHRELWLMCEEKFDA